MELVIRASLLLTLTALVQLLIRRQTPELALLTGIVSVTLVLLAAGGYAKSFQTLVSTANGILGDQAGLTAPLFKCVGVGLVSRLGANFCKDASQGAAAATIELLGTVCALGIAMPLLLSVLKTIGGLL